MRATRPIVTLLAALALSGCVSASFRDSVGQFGAITKATATDQDTRLAAVSADETERVHAALAANAVDLVLDPACAQLLALQVAGVATGPATTGASGQPHCTLRRRDGVTLEDIPTFENLRALDAALSHYADNLILLAADTTEDRAAFSASMTGLGTSLGALDNAFRKATGGAPAKSHDTLNAVASVVAKAGNLYLEVARARALKRIIIAGDPLVSQSVAVLARTGDTLSLYSKTALVSELLAAQAKASDLANTHAPPEDIRAAQDDLYAKLAAFNDAEARGAADQERYAGIGRAHAKLVAAARAGASPAQLHDAILAVIDLAAAAGDLVEAERSEQGGKRGGRK